MATVTCTCNSSPCTCGTSPCQPASVIFECPCTDPGTLDIGAHLSVLNNQFCARRLTNAPGFLVAQQNANGTFQLIWTEEPAVDLDQYQIVQSQEYGNLIGVNADGVWRELLGPATANLFPRTNAAGNLIFDTLPAATIPDPLTLTTINVTNLNAADLVVSSDVTLSGLVAGTVVAQIGLNASNQLVIGVSTVTGAQSCMFFEAPTSPSPTTPNSGVTPGSLLTIGNLIYDSVLPAVAGGALITATNSQTLSVVTAGSYCFDWGGEVTGSNGSPSINLLINGINVNNGNGSANATQVTSGRVANLDGTHSMRLAAGTTIQLQLGSQSGAGVKTYDVRLRAIRTGE